MCANGVEVRALPIAGEGSEPMGAVVCVRESQKFDVCRAIPIILAAIGLLMFLPSCTEFIVTRVPRPFEGSALGLDRPPWSHGDNVEYRVLDGSGDYLGYVNFSFSRDGWNWVLKRSGETARLEEHFVTSLDGFSLRPISQEKTLVTPDGTLEVVARYSGNKVEITAWTGSQPSARRDGVRPDRATLSIPPDAIDNDQLPMVLRSLPFAEGYTLKCTNVIPELFLKTPTTITVLGNDDIETAIGVFHAWKVEADFGQIKHYLWYQVAEPHHLVKYDNGDTLFLLAKANR